MLGNYTLLESFWRISPYATDHAIAKLYVTKKFIQIEGKDRKFSHIQLRKSVIENCLTVYSATYTLHSTHTVTCVQYRYLYSSTLLFFRPILFSAFKHADADACSLNIVQGPKYLRNCDNRLRVHSEYQITLSKCVTNIFCLN